MNKSVLNIDSTIVAIAPILSDYENRRSAERETCRQLVAELVGVPDVTIFHNDDGAPFIDELSVNLSVSHSRSIASVAIDRSAEIGIDIEEARVEQLERVAPRVLSDSELAYYKSIPDGLLIAWTLKEALYKAAGVVGADFRRDINLPIDKYEKKAYVATTDGCAKGFDIIFCDRVSIGNASGWLTVVRRVTP